MQNYVDLRRRFTSPHPCNDHHSNAVPSELLTLDRSNSNHIKCAIALMHGLRSDTNQLVHAVEAGFSAAAYLKVASTTISCLAQSYRRLAVGR